MKKWIIIGGGIQGCTLASYLRKKMNIDANDLVIIDPKDQPLKNWFQFTNRIGMTYLRSPSIHHIDPSPFSLEKFARTSFENGDKKFYAPYDRPDLELFNQHCQEVLSQINIKTSWVQGRVTELTKSSGGWLVTLQDGYSIQGKNVAIAIGLSDQLRWPSWAKEGKRLGANIAHVFDEKEELKEASSVVIIGGGISAAHATLKWSKSLPGQVTMITRQPLTVHQFDADPGWLGPKHMNKFCKVSCYDERRKLIKEARFPGSLPSELRVEIERQRKLGKVTLLIDEVIEVAQNELTLKTGKTLYHEGILLATGFEQKPPGMDWLKKLIEENSLPCASCGYPIPKSSLEWGKGLYLLGALAELQLGPVARNISGARRGAERILASF